MKVVCKCGHKITIQVPPGKEDDWTEYAKKCLCVDCYKAKSGRDTNKDTAMVSDDSFNR